MNEREFIFWLKGVLTYDTYSASENPNAHTIRVIKKELEQILSSEDKFNDQR